MEESAPGARAIPEFRETSDLRAECAGGADTPTTITLYVNGTEVATVKEETGFDSFKDVGFIVLPTQRVEVHFDEVEARALSDDEAEAARARTTTAVQAELPPPPVPTTVAVRDDFSKPSELWPVEKSANASLSYDNGRYRITIKKPFQGQTLSRPVPPPTAFA